MEVILKKYMLGVSVDPSKERAVPLCLWCSTAYIELIK